MQLILSNDNGDFGNISKQDFLTPFACVSLSLPFSLSLSLFLSLSWPCVLRFSDFSCVCVQIQFPRPCWCEIVMVDNLTPIFHAFTPTSSSCLNFIFCNLFCSLIVVDNLTPIFNAFSLTMSSCFRQCCYHLIIILVSVLSRFLFLKL